MLYITADGICIFLTQDLSSKEKNTPFFFNSVPNMDKQIIIKKSSPFFFERVGGSREGKTFFFREKESFPFPRITPPYFFKVISRTSPALAPAGRILSSSDFSSSKPQKSMIFTFS